MIDKNAGRHHWPRLCPLVFAGGGRGHGQVIGQSDRRGGEPATSAITIDDFHATIMHARFEFNRLRIDDWFPKKVIDRAQKRPTDLGVVGLNPGARHILVLSPSSAGLALLAHARPRVKVPRKR